MGAGGGEGSGGVNAALGSFACARRHASALCPPGSSLPLPCRSTQAAPGTPPAMAYAVAVAHAFLSLRGGEGAFPVDGTCGRSAEGGRAGGEGAEWISLKSRTQCAGWHMTKPRPRTDHNGLATRHDMTWAADQRGLGAAAVLVHCAVVPGPQWVCAPGCSGPGEAHVLCYIWGGATLRCALSRFALFAL